MPASALLTPARPNPQGTIDMAKVPAKPVDYEFSVPSTALVVIDKPGKVAFYATPLGDILRLRGTTHLLFAGVTTEVCVQTTMREANDRGYDSLLIEDATESYFPEFKRAAMDMIRAQGAIVGWTATCEQLAAALHK